MRNPAYSSAPSQAVDETGRIPAERPVDVFRHEQLFVVENPLPRLRHDKILFISKNLHDVRGRFGEQRYEFAGAIDDRVCILVIEPFERVAGNNALGGFHGTPAQVDVGLIYVRPVCIRTADPKYSNVVAEERIAMKEIIFSFRRQCSHFFFERHAFVSFLLYICFFHMSSVSYRSLYGFVGTGHTPSALRRIKKRRYI